MYPFFWYHNVLLLSCPWPSRNLMHVCAESPRLSPTLCDPPGSTVHGIVQTRILQWVAILFSRGSSQPRDWTRISRIGRQILYHWATREGGQRISAPDCSLLLQIPVLPPNLSKKKLSHGLAYKLMKRCWFPFNWEYFSLAQNERNLWTAIQLHQNLANSSAHFSRDHPDVQSHRPPQFGNAQGNHGTNHRFLSPGDIQICTLPSGFPAPLFIYYGKIPDLPHNQKTCRHLMFTPSD